MILEIVDVILGFIMVICNETLVICINIGETLVDLSPMKHWVIHNGSMMKPRITMVDGL